MKAEGHSRWAGLHLLGAAGAVAAALLLLAVASLASAAADSGDDADVAKEWVEIVLDLEQLPAADRARSEDRLQAIDDAIATEIPLFRSFDPREVLAESLGQLAALGAELDEEDGAVLNFDTLGATIPVAAREKIAALPWVDQVRYPVAVTPSGVYDSEGLAQIGSTVANAAGVTGAGIKVAIVDDSFNHLNAAMGAPGNELKNIPTTAQYRVNAAGTSYTNPSNLNGTAHQALEGEHGTACAEVVYEVAPGVSFILIGFTAQAAGTQYSGSFTATQVEWAIRRAADLGAKVILVPVYIFHTMSNPTNSFTDDINYATGLGATVVVPAGNEELRHVEERFTPCSDCTNNPSTGQCANAVNNTSYHAWDPTNEFLPLNDILPQGEVETAEKFETLTCYSATSAANPSLYEIRLLRFYDPNDSCNSLPGCPDDCGMTTVTGTTRDLGQGFTVKNLYLYDSNGNDYNYYVGVRRKVSSTVNLCQSGKCIQNGTTSCSNNAQCAAIPWPMIRVACTTGVEELYWATENGKSLSDLAVVNNALAVGGLDAFGGLPFAASYGPSGNSAGPIKPDLVAPGEVSNFTVLDYNISDNLDFTGSSAAAAHVAGVVALLQSYRLQHGFPLLTPAHVKEELQHAATDLGPPGDDVQFGAGLVQVPPGPQSGVPMVDHDPIIGPIMVGSQKVLTGSGFSPGSRIMIFVATASGPVPRGPFTPSAWSPTTLTWNVASSVPLGNGFGTTMVVNTDQGFIQSNTQSQLLYGTASLNIPTILAVKGVPLSPLDPSIPTANVETIVAQGSTITISGTGFNGPLVNLFTAAGNVGPLAPLPGGTATQFQIVIPPQTVTGPGSFQVVNSPYTGNVLSNAVSVPIGSALDIASISQSGSTITVNGAGFSVLTVINFFANSSSGVANFGGLNSQGNAKIPLNFINENQFTFQVPAGALAGAAYVMALNPPFIPFSSTTGDPQGSFSLTIP